MKISEWKSWVLGFRWKNFSLLLLESKTSSSCARKQRHIALWVVYGMIIMMIHHIWTQSHKI